MAKKPDWLPSWQEDSSKLEIIRFIDDVTNPNSLNFVPQASRVAVFDNDGTLWSEQPAYFQLVFAIEKLKQKAANDPSIVTNDFLRIAVEEDIEKLMSVGDAALLEIVNLTHTGLSVEEFQAEVANWLEVAIHPVMQKRYKDMVFAPMVELLRYLDSKGFKSWIVSGGGIHFMRAFASETYGIPIERIIGSSNNALYKVIDGVGAIVKRPGLLFLDDGASKPIGIDAHIGQRPIFAAGNSDGDFEMLEYTTSGQGPSMGLIVHHTDDKREFAYDHVSFFGKLERGLKEAEDRGWLVVDMKKSWKRVWIDELKRNDDSM